MKCLLLFHKKMCLKYLLSLQQPTVDCQSSSMKFSFKEEWKRSCWEILMQTENKYQHKSKKREQHQDSLLSFFFTAKTAVTIVMLLLRDLQSRLFVCRFEESCRSCTRLLWITISEQTYKWIDSKETTMSTKQCHILVTLKSSHTSLVRRARSYLALIINKLSS